MSVVFLLCGFWHGASWTFVAWGVLHGTVLIIERAVLLKGLAKVPVALQRLYTMVLVVSGWILFRADSFGHAARFFRAVFRLNDWRHFDWHALNAVVSTEARIAIVFGALAATPLLRKIAVPTLAKQTADNWNASPAGAVVLVGMFLLTVMKLANSSFNPFIYYRF